MKDINLADYDRKFLDSIVDAVAAAANLPKLEGVRAISARIGVLDVLVNNLEGVTTLYESTTQSEELADAAISSMESGLWPLLRDKWDKTGLAGDLAEDAWIEALKEG